MGRSRNLLFQIRYPLEQHLMLHRERVLVLLVLVALLL